MRAVKLLVLLCFVMSFTALMFAGPRVEISDPGCDGGTNVPGLTFSFNNGPTGANTFFSFCNGSTQTYTTMLISFDATGITGNDIFCGGDAFKQCDIYQDGVLVNSFQNCEFECGDTERPAFNGFSNLTDPANDPHFDLYFTANPGFPGIASGNQFTIDIGCHDINGCTPFDPNTAFSGVANGPAPSVPEPATLVLLASAGVPQLVRRLRRRK